MSLGLVGRKCGMTRLFTEEGESIPVSVVQILPNRVTRVLNEQSDGYSAVQVTTGDVKNSRVNKAEAGQFKKAGVEAGRGLWEFRLEEDSDLEVGSDLSLDIFEAGQKIDVRGKSIGKGYAGVIKRYNFQMQDATHGNSLSHRAPGSIGQCQTPGRVLKGKKMSGHMGDERVTTQNLEIVKIDTDKSVVLIKGAIPGSKNSDIVITPAIKTNK
ncbi:MAG: 50S ribosomal protein L3 [Cycloclasticus pugetii]|jgi:large subunit ribosomal protein L3|uniref:Large ribosomal subunit protein uL3 n=2 Tax=Cycloclasticus TaxID=34067 RepID=S5T5I1_9GAMM|nr:MULTISPECIES: 50S ribosomal protein L3 [Cycloclasticus]AFT67749.1 50S ribosomal protein L3 [Cycloclasticus sp. P1]AGS39081.1 50S ribosomal protein L3 [Cycloclasticus zancles 78-ME]ATI02707.1 50S ribosomal protein L3 [Cycloclasticus sp. PY97N]EPD13451.1 50S ribosomal protein L3 [Cycloclasticus pugetii]MBV1897804.1 50S ribosomal protein L3 [Cycloclasticus sp.]